MSELEFTSKAFLSLVFCQRTSSDKEQLMKKRALVRTILILCNKYSPHSHPKDVSVCKSQVVIQVFYQTRSNHMLLIISHASFYSCSECSGFSSTKKKKIPQIWSDLLFSFSLIAKQLPSGSEQSSCPGAIRWTAKWVYGGCWAVKVVVQHVLMRQRPD